MVIVGTAVRKWRKNFRIEIRIENVPLSDRVES